MTSRSLLSMPVRRARERGAMAVIGAVMVLVILAVLGMALDLGRIVNRRLELDTVARAAALLGSRQLDGTPGGIDAALAQAATMVNALRYDQYRSPFVWNDDVLSFSATADGEWLGASAARAAAARMLFVRADTSRLTAPERAFALVLASALPGVPTALPVTATAVAGRSGIEVAPLAVCAMSAMAAAARANPGPPATQELVEYGFRRGVGYDLMQLNSHGAASENFVIDPFAPPGTTGEPAGVSAAAVGPYLCSGELALTRVGGGAITVQRPFPLGLYAEQLNARFNQYVGARCTYATAPPDRNVKSYLRGANTPWMTAVPDQQGARLLVEAGKRWTIADPLPAPVGNVAAQYGPLWAYARPVPFSAYQAGVDEPANGYAPFAPGDWAGLYAPGAPVAKSYPEGTSTPYLATSAGNYQPPPAAMRGVSDRRVLHVALLACPVAPGSTAATVLGVGKFMMTVPATATSLYAEFGGLVPEHALRGPVELYR